MRGSLLPIDGSNMKECFRLATFNLENLDWSPTRETEFARRMAVLKPILRDLSADVVCLQEVDAQKTPTQRASEHLPRRFLALDRLLADTPYEAFHRATSARPGTGVPADVHNLAILSRWPLGEQRQIHHDIVAKWSWTPPRENGAAPAPVEITWDRPLLYACVAMPDGAPLHVINLHLRAPRAVPVASTPNARERPSSRAFAQGQFLAAQKREGQALEARLFTERLFDREPGARIAICGDFNADEHDAPTRLLRGAPEENAGADFPRALEALETRVAPERRFSVIHAGRPTLIDHILVSRALAGAAREVAIINEGLQDEAWAAEPIVGSLHAPVVATFDFAGAPARSP